MISIYEEIATFVLQLYIFSFGYDQVVGEHELIEEHAFHDILFVEIVANICSDFSKAGHACRRGEESAVESVLLQ